MYRGKIAALKSRKVYVKQAFWRRNIYSADRQIKTEDKFWSGGEENFAPISGHDSPDFLPSGELKMINSAHG